MIRDIQYEEIQFYGWFKKNCDFEKIHGFENELTDGPKLVLSSPEVVSIIFLVRSVATKMI